jgi:zinc transporter ZupT
MKNFEGGETEKHEHQQPDIIDVIEDGKEGVQTISKTTGIILAFAMGFHAFFEGIAFGLLVEINLAFQLSIGILIHKTAASISLGGAFARTGYSFMSIFILILIFALCAPIGIIIGMSIQESHPLLDVFFLAVSGGTFLYVACSEIIVHEFDRGSMRGMKMFLVILGGVIIAALWFLGGHSHAEEGEHHDDHDDEDDHRLIRMLHSILFVK